MTFTLGAVYSLSQLVVDSVYFTERYSITMRRYRTTGNVFLTPPKQPTLRLSQYEHSEDDEKASDSDTYQTDADKLSNIIVSHGIKVT